MGFTVVPDRAAGYAVAETDWDTSIKANFNTGTWARIGAVELSSSNTITFTSIPGTFAHLMLIGSVRGAHADFGVLGMLRFNGDTGSNYDGQQLFGTATTIAGGEYIGTTGLPCCSMPAASATADVFGAFRVVIPHYANTTRNKAAIATSSTKVTTTTGGLAPNQIYGSWRNNAAITQVEFRALSGPNVVAGSRVHLFAMAA